MQVETMLRLYASRPNLDPSAKPERSFTEGVGGGEVVVAVVDEKGGGCKTVIKEGYYGSGVVQRVIEKIEELLNGS